MQVQRIDFKKRKDLDVLLASYKDIYAVESLVEKGLVYGISDGWFAFITAFGIMRVNYTDIKEFALKLKLEVREEVLALYEDTKDVFERSGGKWVLV